MMARRYESYLSHVVRPFFREHFSRLDRQIVLVDVLGALNGGTEATLELERAMASVLRAFRPGAASWLASLFGGRRIDRLPRSGIRGIMELALQLPDVVRLDIGDPDFPTPDHIVEAAANASGGTSPTARSARAWRRYSASRFTRLSKLP